MKYLCLKKKYFQFGKYSITSLRQEDIMLIKDWRNEQISVLRQKKLLTEEDQYNYYKHTVLPSMKEKRPNIILFSYLIGEVCIGYGGLTNIDWLAKRAEISFLLDTKRIKDAEEYNNDFSVFLSFMKKVAFKELHFNRLFTETFDIRSGHIKTLKENGFKLEGRLKQHNYIEGEYVDSLMHACLREDM